MGQGALAGRVHMFASADLMRAIRMRPCRGTTTLMLSCCGTFWEAYAYETSLSLQHLISSLQAPLRLAASHVLDMQLTKDSSVPAALYACIRLAWYRVAGSGL